MRRWIPGFLSLCLVTFGSFTKVRASSARQPVEQGMVRLQAWYDPATGLWAKPANWWNAANATTVLANYRIVTGKKTYDEVLANTFARAAVSQHSHDFTNKYYDDSGWWALAWIAAYDATGRPAYLQQAQAIFPFLAGGWDDVCGGGLYWTTDRRGKNAIPNELFLEVAARLANRTTGDLAAYYRGWAEREWRWFQSSGMINAKNLVNDGLDAACKNDHKTEWTYNQGVIVGGLVAMSRFDSDPALLHQATAIADATMRYLTIDGVLVDRTVHGGDAPQFKGIFMRNLMALYQRQPDPRYRQFFSVNAHSILANDQDASHAYGGLWQGPFDGADATRQTSALDALLGNVAVQGRQPSGRRAAHARPAQQARAIHR